MPQRSGLGKGLDALIPTGQPSVGEGGVTQIQVERIARNPRQPRTRFDPGELQELAASIREHGVIQPLIVAPPGADGRYVLIAGERRLEAARKAGLKTVPAVVRQASDQQLLEWALIENIQRADLNPLEQAEAYRQLTEDFGLSHEQVAAQVGKSRVAVTNTLRLLQLSDAARQALADGRISEGHARALLSLSSAAAQAAALQTILARDLSVRQTEELVRKLGGKKPARRVKSRRAPPEITALEERLRQALGTRVVLHHGKKGGSLVIHYYSDEELDALTARLLKK